LTVWAEGYQAATVPASLTLGGSDVEVELERGEQPLFEGSLLKQGQGLPGVTISIAPEAAVGWPDDDWRVIDAIRTDAQGRFSFRVPPGLYLLRFQIGDSPRMQPVDIPLAQPLVIDLERDAAVRVHVRSSTGTPCTSHPVSLMSDRRYTRRKSTDEHGDVLFEALPAGKWTLAMFRDPGQQWGSSDVWKELELAAGREESLEVVIPATEPRFARLVVAGETDLSTWRFRDSDWSSGRTEQVEGDGRIPCDIQHGNHRFEFDNGGSQRWLFRIPKDPPADLPLRIDPSGPAYEIELVDSATREPIPLASIVAVTGVPTWVCGTTDAQGRVRLRGITSEVELLEIHLRSFEGDEIQFVPARPPGLPAAEVLIELPRMESEKFPGLPEIHLRGTARLDGAPLAATSGQACAMQTQAGGTLLLRPRISRFRTDEAGRYELWMPYTGRARLLTWGSDRLNPIEWEPTPGLMEQSRDFDF
jgi:hypothetical protein